jgi:hypothetical protein
VGLPWSLENIRSWRSQFERVKRWKRRIDVLETNAQVGRDIHEDVDTYLAFFVNCFSLRDWFINSATVPRHRLRRALDRSLHMGLCRDICNRSKHLKLHDSPSVDESLSIAMEFRGDDAPNALVLLAAGEKYDLSDVAERCMRFWDDFIVATKPAEPGNPFDPKATT